MVERNVSEQEIRTAGARAEIIEKYPEDRYSPSVSLLGSSHQGIGAAPQRARRGPGRRSIHRPHHTPGGQTEDLARMLKGWRLPVHGPEN
ncbi:MAG: DUF4258 domain-containing protein [Gammaproteobacteria bacterium]|nr:DUF4258 domain-containing protein [Gammaproteobacteria bacterium]